MCDRCRPEPTGRTGWIAGTLTALIVVVVLVAATGGWPR